MSEKDRDKIPQRSPADHAHTLLKASISAIPLVGGSATEFFSTLFAPPISKRRESWFESLADRLKLLEDKGDGLTIETLQDNEAFISSVMQATHAALRTHYEEKLDALRNAVVNVAVGAAPDDDLQSIFLTLIDAFTPLHLRLLHVFRDRASAPSEVFQKLRLDQAVSDPVIGDLYDRGLIAPPPHLSWSRGSGSNPVTQQPLIDSEWRLTKLGSEFLAFVSSPDSDQG